MSAKVLRQFLQMEAASGIILFIMAIAALVICNSALAGWYQQIFAMPLINQPLLFWINEGLMPFFFLLVGLELKRELVQGKLSRLSQTILPLMSAAGGMLIPALIYITLNLSNDLALQGWGVPIATDIAFALGVLSLFGKRVPISLKLFLMMLAVIDDIGAILVIAIFYTHAVSGLFLFFAGLVMLVIVMMNFFGIRKLPAYLVLGVCLWFCILHSGVHATVAGVLLAMVIPVNQVHAETISPLKHLEEKLHPWVAYMILPLFAFANTNLSFAGLNFSMLGSSVVLGIVLGLFFGKQIGVLFFMWITVKFRWASLPSSASWLELYGVALLCGVGFTMSLFLGTLAFQDNNLLLAQMRLGVLIASVLASLAGSAILRYALWKRVPLQ